MATTLITGASGFIGQHLAAALRARGDRVTCLVRQTSKADRLIDLGCELVFGDVTEAEALTEALDDAAPDSIYHLAGLTKARRKQQLFDVNQRGTANLLAAVAGLGATPTVVLVSTLATVGPALNGRAKREIDPLAPVSYYGRSKLAAERTAGEFAERIPISVVRPPIVLGPRDRDGFELFRSISKFKLHPVPATANMTVSWIHVDDLVRALVRVMDKGQRLGGVTPGAGVYFATSDEVVQYAELGRLIGQKLGKQPVMTPCVSAFVVWAIATMNEAISLVNGRPHIMNFDKAREATAGSWTCSGEKLARETGFRCEISLEQALATCARWYLEAGWLG